MSGRQVLLIDNDPNFADLLRHTLLPYQVAVEHVPDGGEGLARAMQLNPVLIFIGVDLPDKLGYALCNKAKKGVAKDIPVILATSSVPPADLEQHRRLKVHADEYMDKRTLTGDEIVQKVDILIGLGAPQWEGGDGMLQEDVDMADSVEISVDDAIEESVSIAADFADEAESTRLNDFVDHAVDEETEAAFAAMSLDDGGAAALYEDPAALLDEFGAPEDAPPSVVDAHPLSMASGEILGHGATVPYEEPAYLAEPASAFEPNEGETHALDTGLGLYTDEAAAQAEYEELPPIEEAADEGTYDGRAETTEFMPENGPDLLAGAGFAETTSGYADTTDGGLLAATEHRVQELELEVQRLRAEAAQPSDSSKFSREREFLHLREVINKKDKELLSIRDEIANRDQAALDLKSRLRQLEKAVSDAETRALEVEGRLVSVGEETEALAREKQRTESGIADLQARLASAEAALEAARKTTAEADARGARNLAETQKQHQAALAQAADAARVRHEEALKQGLADQERRLRSEHESATSEAQTKNDIKMGHLRNEHAQKLESLRQEHVTALAERDRNHETMRAQAAASAAESHRGELLVLTQEHAARIEERDTAHANALTSLERRMRDEHAAVVAKMTHEQEERRQSELARADAQQRAAVAAVQKELQAAQQIIAERDGAVSRLEADLRDRDLRIDQVAVRAAELERDLASAQDQLLRAVKRIKAEEVAMDKAKKAMAIALTLLDEQKPSA